MLVVIMAKKKIGVGIIGCGAVSKAHINAYLELDNECEIKAIADINLENAVKIAALIPGKVDIYEDINTLVKREDIDVLSICTPPYLHREQVIASLSSGKHVICEKPFASSLADCDEMIAASKHFNRKLSISHQLRFGRDIKRVKHIVKSGMLGDIVFAQVQSLYWRGDSYFQKAWRGSWELEGGGVLMTQAIHPLDLLIDILGPVKKVKAEMDTVSHQAEVEDYITASVEFKNGVQAYLLSTLNSVNNEMKITLSGKTKSVQWPLNFHAVTETNSGFPVFDPKGLQALSEKAEEITTGRDDHFAPITDMIAAIKENREPLVNGAEARRTIEVVTGIYKAASTNQTVYFPIEKNDPWYSREGIISNVKRKKLNSK
jgi:UDP-N-acetyl-2-amino-2-deoxyglucuronate dehydrogenase